MQLNDVCSNKLAGILKRAGARKQIGMKWIQKIVNKYTFVAIGTIVLWGVCLIDIFLRVLENNIVFSICMGCLLIAILIIIFIVSSRKMDKINHLQNIPSIYIPLAIGDLPEGVQQLIHKELLRSLHLTLQNRAHMEKIVSEKNQCQETTNLRGVDFRQAILATVDVLEDELSSSRDPPLLRRRNQPIRSYLLQFVNDNSEIRGIAEIYLESYEQVRFNNLVVTEAYYKDFLKHFALVIRSCSIKWQFATENDIQT